MPSAGVKKYKPTTPGRRLASVDDFSDITKTKPEKSLVTGKHQKAGRSKGKITVRHRGGGHKRKYRLIDFRQDKFEIPGRVDSIEYDPNRTARIALVVYKDGEKRYLLAPQDLNVGDTVISSQKEKIEANPGNRGRLVHLPVGIPIFNIELNPGRGGSIVRSAGLSAQLMAITGEYAQVKLPSSEIRLIPKESMASVGQVSNPEHRNVRLGKAGRMRHRGFRPTVRGKAMNPVDHPHGGGEGSNPIGLKHPKTPWGKPALGPRTRSKTKASNKFIVKRRKTKKR